MVFSSIIFLFWFLPLFFLAYYCTPVKFRNYTALVGSYFFYAWGAPTFLGVLFVMSIFDYVISIRIARTTRNARLRKILLIIGLLGAITPLLYFKYSNFFVGEINSLLQLIPQQLVVYPRKTLLIIGLMGPLAPLITIIFKWTNFFTIEVNTILQLIHPYPIKWVNVILPIGISFISLHRISYLVDVFRGIVKPPTRFIDYALYLALFPHSIAGPIIRYHNIAEQLRSRIYSMERIYIGSYRFCLGLAKKVLIANMLGQTADAIFQLPISSLTPGYAWLGAICYTFQIFFDFSGYSDMAIGLAKMIGMDFPENFNHPYLAENFTDFWRRWHMTLSAWMKEYIYIPLGGNRISPFRTYFNLLVVFLISGLWHGANWTFILWGLYQGFFIIIDKMFWLKLSQKVPRVLKIFSTFFFTLIGWVFFRSQTVTNSFSYLSHMFGFSRSLGFNGVWMDYMSNRGIVILILAVLISFFPFYKEKSLEGNSNIIIFRRNIVAVVLFLLSIMSLLNSSFNPFIYFQF